MKLISLFTTIITIILFANCAQPVSKVKNPVISINPGNDKNDHLPGLEIQSIIQFEQSDSSLFGHPSAMECVLDRIYILDIFKTKSLLVFNKNGQYINRSKIGKAPGEMINPFALYVHRDNKAVFVWDQTLQSLFQFNPDLNLISQNMYDVAIHTFAVLDNGEFLVHNHFYHDYCFKIYSSDFSSVKKNYIPDFNYSGGMGLSRSISTSHSNLLITPFDYNIYEFKHDTVVSKYLIEMDDQFKTNRTEIEEIGIRGFFDLVREGSRISGPNEISEGETYLLFHVYFNKEPWFYLYHKINGNVYNLNQYFANGVLPKCKVRGIIENDVLYATIDPVDLIEFHKESRQKLIDTEIKEEQPLLFITFSLNEDES